VAIFDINPDAGHETAKLAPKSAITTYTVDVGDRAFGGSRGSRRGSRPENRPDSGFSSTTPAGTGRCRS